MVEILQRLSEIYIIKNIFDTKTRIETKNYIYHHYSKYITMIKFYESHFEEYCGAVEKYNLHPELLETYSKFPKNIANFSNLIVYGPSGIGKYSQVLTLLKRYSMSDLKYEKKITVQTEKQSYLYHISDIHYEVDMSLLGCNSKILWHEIFLQVVDIISVKAEKIGIIVCKNFHTIHTELLEIFYSYMQQYNHQQSNIQIKFILISEHASFIPNNILNSCYMLSMKRPDKERYSKIFKSFHVPKTRFETKDEIPSQKIVDTIEPECILNIKEIRSLSILDDAALIPKDIFNVICDNIIKEIENHDKIAIPAFRDIIYDILIYNLDIGECLWYILSYFIKTNELSPSVISAMTTKIFSFLKYYNNNYRPIYHLESIFFYFIIKIHLHE